ncbi:MAG: carboxymuconolactone decarboxylase family protein, partial [Candidatus Rokuibacteriota bacterium]
MQAGASAAKIAQVERAAVSDLFSAGEKAAIAYAEAITATGQKVDDALFARVREHFSEPEIVELTAA